MENQLLFPTEAGRHRAGSSRQRWPTWTLDGLERLLKETFRRKEIQGKAHKSEGKTLCVMPMTSSSPGVERVTWRRSQALVERFPFDTRGFALSLKTCITHIEQGLTVPGAEHAQIWRRLWTHPPRKNMHAFLEKVAWCDSLQSHCEQENLSWCSTDHRGWANYHRISWRLRRLRKAEMSSALALAMGEASASGKSLLPGSRSDTGIGWEAQAFLRCTLDPTRNAGDRLWLGVLIPPRLQSGVTVKVKSDAHPRFSLRGYFENRKRLDRLRSSLIMCVVLTGPAHAGLTHGLAG